MIISGKVAIVTGGCCGIGKGIVYALLQKAAKVAVLDINDANGCALETKLKGEFGEEKAIYMHCDVTQKKELEDTFGSVKKHFGGLDIIVNNAGIANNDLWEKEIEIDLTAVIRGTKIGIEMMDKNSGNAGGVIINMASMAGIEPASFMATYSAAKSGVVAFTRAMRPVAKTNGVLVNCICPSFVTGTDMFDDAKKNLAESHPGVLQVIEKVGLISVDKVVDAVVQTIENDKLAGRAIAVTNNYGTYQVEFLESKI